MNSAVAERETQNEPESPSALKREIAHYFGADEDLRKFGVSHNDTHYEITLSDGSRGYVFVMPTRDRSNLSAEKSKLVKSYLAGGKESVKEFIDFQNGVAGFSWRIK